VAGSGTGAGAGNTSVYLAVRVRVVQVSAMLLTAYAKMLKLLDRINRSCS